MKTVKPTAKYDSHNTVVSELLKYRSPGEYHLTIGEIEHRFVVDEERQVTICADNDKRPHADVVIAVLEIFGLATVPVNIKCLRTVEYSRRKDTSRLTRTVAGVALGMGIIAGGVAVGMHVRGTATE